MGESWQRWEKEPIVIEEHEVVPCPGCGRDIAYSVKDGWVDVFGTKECEPRTSSHGSHIDMLLIRETKK